MRVRLAALAAVLVAAVGGLVAGVALSHDERDDDVAPVDLPAPTTTDHDDVDQDDDDDFEPADEPRPQHFDDDEDDD